MKAAEKVETAVVSYEEKALAEYHITPEDVRKKATEFMALKVIPDDAKSYKAARAALTLCVSTRTSLDRRRKALKEDAVKWGRVVDQTYRDLVAPLAPVEEHLSKELDLEDGRKAEIKAKKAEEERLRVEDIRAKITALQSLPATLIGKTAAELSAIFDQVFSGEITETTHMEFTSEALTVKESVLDAVTAAIEAREKFDKEEVARKAEADRLAKQKAEQEAEAARLAAEKKAQDEAAAKVKAEQETEARRLEGLRKEADETKWKSRFAMFQGAIWRPTEEDAYDDVSGTIIATKSQLLEMPAYEFDAAQKAWNKIIADREAARVIAEAEAKAEFERKAKEKAEAEARAKVQQEAKEKAEKEEADKKEAERKEALKPDKEKIVAYCFAVLSVVEPELSSQTARELMKEFQTNMGVILYNLKARAEAL